MVTLPPTIAPHIPLYGSRLLRDEGEIYGRELGDLMKGVSLNVAILGMFI